MVKSNIDNLPLVTIFTLVYNTGKYVIEAIESIRDQTYPSDKIQHIIIDDYSTDGSRELVEDYINKNNHRCTYIKHEENWGICKTLNEILDIAQGKYICSVSDDLYMPDKVEKQVDALEKADENYAVVYSDAIYIDENSIKSSEYTVLQNRKLRLKNLLSGDIREELVDGSFISAPTVLIKTDLIRKSGGYDESLAFEDWDLWLRLSKNYKFLFLNEVVVKYRRFNNSMSNSFNEEYLISILKIVKREYKENSNFIFKGRSSLRKLLRKSSLAEKFKLLKEYSFLIDYSVIKGVFNR